MSSMVLARDNNSKGGRCQGECGRIALASLLSSYYSAILMLGSGNRLPCVNLVSIYKGSEFLSDNSGQASYNPSNDTIEP